MAPLDLNLVRTFNMLMEQRSVTQAARQLNVTQSAVSHALRRLRDYLGDPLFIRSPDGLRPTPRAEAIAAGVRNPLQQLEAALRAPHFAPSTANTVFEISAGSYVASELLPFVVAAIRADAPGISLRLSAPDPGLRAALDSGQVDLAIGSFGAVADRLRIVPLFDEELVWIAAGETSGGPSLDKTRIAERPRLEIAAGTVQPRTANMTVMAGLEQQIALASGRAGPPAVRVHDVVSAAAMVAASDLVALVPHRTAVAEAKRWPLAIVRLDRPETVTLSMVFHSRVEADPAHQWLRDQLLSACKSLSRNSPRIERRGRTATG